jgi:hypothetical protein
MARLTGAGRRRDQAWRPESRKAAVSVLHPSFYNTARVLYSGSTSAKDQVDDDNYQDEVDDTSAVIAKSRSHIITATAEEEHEDNEKND